MAMALVTTGRACIAIGSAAIAVAALAWTACAAPIGELGWIGYLNARFGLRVDIPASGFRRDLSPTGTGLTLTSRDGAISIDVHANWLAGVLPEATRNAGQSITSLHEQAIAATRQKGGIIGTSVRRDDSYVISGTLGSMAYYERVVISPACPDVFDAIRVKYPQAIGRELDALVARMASSLRAVCPPSTE
jgi:hypothetical protein